jgi:hypothetical protein
MTTRDGLHPIFSSFVLAKGWGLAYLPPKEKCHSPAHLPMPLHFFPTAHPYSLAAGAERSPAQRSGAQAAPSIPPSQSGRSFIMH